MSWEELTHWKRLWCWEGLGEGGEGTTEDEVAGWHHWLDGHEFVWTPGVGDGQGGPACCDSWGCKESDMTERLNWTDWTDGFSSSHVRCEKSEKESEVSQSCPTLCDPMDCSLSGFSVHGIFQARVLEWIAISFSRGSSGPRNRTQVSHIAGRCFIVWATREAYHMRVRL